MGLFVKITYIDKATSGTVVCHSKNLGSGIGGVSSWKPEDHIPTLCGNQLDGSISGTTVSPSSIGVDDSDVTCQGCVAILNAYFTEGRFR